MSNDAPILPEDPAVLKAMIAALQAENAKMAATIRAHDQLIQTLRLRIAKLKKQAFGKSSEKIEREIEQLELALEDLLIASAESVTTPAEEDEADAGLEVTTDDIDAGKPRRRPRVSATTPRERRELDPGSCCPHCGGDLRLVGEDMSEMLDLVAAQLKVLQIARLKKSCRRCEKMVQTSAPSRPIPGSMASAALLAWILVSKFDDHVPLYRQTEIFARMGAEIPDSTLVDWCGRAMQVLAPLVERIEADVMATFGFCLPRPGPIRQLAPTRALATSSDPAWGCGSACQRPLSSCVVLRIGSAWGTDRTRATSSACLCTPVL